MASMCPVLLGPVVLNHLYASSFKGSTADDFFRQPSLKGGRKGMRKMLPFPPRACPSCKHKECVCMCACARTYTKHVPGKQCASIQCCFCPGRFEPLPPGVLTTQLHLSLKKGCVPMLSCWNPKMVQTKKWLLGTKSKCFCRLVIWDLR